LYFKYALPLRRKGCTAVEIEEELQCIRDTYCEAGTDPVRDPEISKIAKSAAKKPVGDPATLTRNRALIQQIILLVERYAWHGIGGATDREVLLAFLNLAFQAGTLMIGASVRNLAKSAGVSTVTACKSVKRLKRQWLRREGSNEWKADRGNRRGTGIYSIRVPQELLSTIPHIPQNTYPEGGELLYKSTPLPHDAFRWGGLGKNARVILSLLDRASWKSQAALAAAAAMKRDTLKPLLRKLKLHGLATRDHGWWQRGPADLDGVAATLPTNGALQRQLAEHECDRELYDQWLVYQEQRSRGRTRRLRLVPTDKEPGEREAVLAVEERKPPLRAQRTGGWGRSARGQRKVA
jgi:hypothetical protein